MTFNVAHHHRRSIRLRGYDYAQAGAYFVTICTQDRACLFGHAVDGVMRLNDAGHMVAHVWTTLPGRFPTFAIDEIVVMPNHIHAVLVVGAPLVGAPDDGDQENDGNHAGDGNRGGGDHGGGNRGGGDHGGGNRGGGDHGGGDRGGGNRAGGNHRGGHKGRPNRATIGDCIGAFKSETTVLYGRGASASGWPTFRRRLWQRNYYEHIIRDEESLNHIRQYIRENPARWTSDRENPPREGSLPTIKQREAELGARRRKP